MKKSTLVIVMVLILGIAIVNGVSAEIVSFDVYAREHSINFNYNISYLDTGIYLNAGNNFRVYTDPKDTWSAGDPADNTTNANGMTYGQTYNGYYFNYGELVGQIGNGSYFSVGVNFNGNAQNSGTLRLMQWDCHNGNNSGFITATVNTNPVPIPAAVWLLGTGLLGLVGFRRKIKK